jgi:hypothetical protein
MEMEINIEEDWGDVPEPDFSIPCDGMGIP